MARPSWDTESIHPAKRKAGSQISPRHFWASVARETTLFCLGKRTPSDSSSNNLRLSVRLLCGTRIQRRFTFPGGSSSSPITLAENTSSTNCPHSDRLSSGEGYDFFRRTTQNKNEKHIQTSS